MLKTTEHGGGAEPVAWSYEQATDCVRGTYIGWERRLVATKPIPSCSSIRNVQPLYPSPPTRGDAQAEVARLRSALQALVDLDEDPGPEHEAAWKNADEALASTSSAEPQAAASVGGLLRALEAIASGIKTVGEGDEAFETVMDADDMQSIAADALAAAPVTGDREAVGVAQRSSSAWGGEWCQPRDDEGGNHRVWIVRYADAEVGDCVFTGPDAEREARDHFERADRAWTCWLFASAPAVATPPSGGDDHAAAPAKALRARVLELLPMWEVERDAEKVSDAEDFGAGRADAFAHVCMQLRAATGTGIFDHAAEPQAPDGGVGS